ncbi:MAG: zinc ribbon domain-containing protein [Chloroflexi bacterium]|nr:zinc ribbon domain-containing protein [Chloroflexota bacterium]
MVLDGRQGFWNGLYAQKGWYTMADQRVYQAPEVDLGQLGQALVEWFQRGGFEAQAMPAPGEGVLVQARKPEGWRQFLGMSAALNVSLVKSGDLLTVQTGAAPWADKAVVGAVGALLFWPALIPAAYGAWQQKKLPDQVFDFVNQYIMGGGKVITALPFEAAPTQEAAMTCPSCGHAVREGAKFCDNCGARLEMTCPQCGHTLRPGAKFCDHCGAKVIEEG